MKFFIFLCLFFAVFSISCRHLNNTKKEEVDETNNGSLVVQDYNQVVMENQKEKELDNVRKYKQMNEAIDRQIELIQYKI